MSDDMPDTGAGGGLEALAFGDVEQELAQTRRLLERLPPDRLDFRPHEKSWSLGELAAHVANLLFWQTGILEDDEFDLESGTGGRDAPDTLEGILDDFDRNAARLRDALAATDERALGEPWTLRSGEHVIFTRPRAVVFRNAGVSHMIHHRGQLVVYLRLLDEPVPGLYGPSADEKEGAS